MVSPTRFQQSIQVQTSSLDKDGYRENLNIEMATSLRRKNEIPISMSRESSYENTNNNNSNDSNDSNSSSTNNNNY